MKKILSSRLESLKIGFREEEKAQNGFNKLFKSVNSNELKILLRNHKEKGIYDGNEIKDRDNIDFSLAFISLLSIAYRINYLSFENIKNEFSEEIALLFNQHICKYYSNHYHLPLLVWFSKVIENPKKIKKECSSRRAKNFETFLYLLRGRMDDECIDSFLWLLDSGHIFDKESNHYLNIDLFWEKINFYGENIENNSNSTKLFRHIFLGLIYFIEYLENLNDLIFSAKNDKVFCSLIWAFESYWLTNLKFEINSNIVERIKFLYYNQNIKNVNIHINESEMNRTFKSIQNLLYYKNHNNYKYL